MASLAGKRVVVVGLGTSGLAACRLLRLRDAVVVGTDSKTDPSADVRALEGLGVSLVLGDHRAANFAEADVIVVSPGVPSFPALDAAARKGVPIWSEVELAYQALSKPAPIIAIGGTNGKSTTTELVGEMLRRSCKGPVFVGGNLGEPLSAHADEAFDAIVLEASSFQLERLVLFRPDVSVLLNVTPDHLDRYPSVEAYASAKGNAFERQTEKDLAVVPFGDELCAGQARRGRARLVTFGEGGDVDVRHDAIVDRRRSLTIALDELRLRGVHNAMNFAAAMAATSPFAIEADVYRAVAREFRGLPHRMDLVGEVGGVRYYDDSKGTNVGAAVTALRGTREPKVVLIAGGRDKGGSYAPLAESLREKGRGLVLVGEAADTIAGAMGAIVPIVRAASMGEAVRAAASLARAGDAVLLSPACSSFDMFRDYKERGDAFASAVKALRRESTP